MKKVIFVCLSILFDIFNYSYSQTAVPYSNNFDNPGDTDGWSHYAINGTDDWELGVPKKTYFSLAYSGSNAWVTDLDNTYAGYSERVLETPVFNLTSTAKDYVLSIYQKRHTNNANTYYYIEYSTDNGLTWKALDNATAKKKNWKAVYSSVDNYNVNFQHSAINLRFIQGQASVKFRFRFVSDYPNGEGWMIDNFKIDEEYYNYFALAGDPIFISSHYSIANVKTTVGFDNQYSNSYSCKTNYYYSKDAVLDLNDPLIGSKTGWVNSTEKDWNQLITLPSNLNAGTNYIFFKHDALNALVERNEDDNVGYAVIKLDTVYSTPYCEDFESNARPWNAYLGSTGKTLLWELGKGYRHHIEDAHSGKNAWHTSKTIDFNFSSCSYGCNKQYVESPYFDLTTSNGDKVISFWFKNQIECCVIQIQYSGDCGTSYPDLYTFQRNRDDEWDYVNIPINSLTPLNNLKFRVSYFTTSTEREGVVFDDFYVGSLKSDLSIERDKDNRFTAVSSAKDSIKYYVYNSGSATSIPTTTSFYWSTDSIFDSSDILLGNKQELPFGDNERRWTTFVYNKPTASQGKYYIFYFLDSENSLDEMREANNTGYFTLFQENSKSIPYTNNFESNIDGWKHNASLGIDDWQWTTPQKTILNAPFSGTKAWITNNTGLVSSMSRMHLYTPVFNLSNVSKPVLEFNMKLNSDQACSCFEGKMNMSYSIDGGATWQVLDTTSQSYNRWYYPTDYDSYGGYDVIGRPNYSELLFAISESTFVAMNQPNGRDANSSYRYIIDLSFLADKPNVQFRFNLATKKNNSQSPNAPVEGAMIDDFSIKEATIDLNVNYKKSLMISSLAKEVKFFMNITNHGNYISNASISKFYLSSDTIIDGSDFYLGQESIVRVRPEMNYYLNAIFAVPNTVSQYRYLLYQLDANNSNSEINEENNNGYWNLALDSITFYPYFEDFNDTVVNGWNHYVKTISGTHLKKQYRFRNMVAPDETLYQTAIKSGEMFTDRINSNVLTMDIPIWYLETPSFNFSNLDSISMTFNLMCTGSFYSSTDGGNMDFSIDGGNTWTVLTTQYGQAQNWYNSLVLDNLNKEPGWSGTAAGYGVSVLSPTVFDLSFLKEQKNVVLRFKYRSNLANYGEGTVQGMRIDNFKMEGFGRQSINFNELDTLTYGHGPYNLVAKASSGLDVSFSSSNPEIASISGSTLTIVNAGVSTITASQSGNKYYKVAPEIQRELLVNKAALQAIADDKIRNEGQNNPVFTVSYSGFVNNENELVLDSQSIATCSATIDSPVGVYDIILNGGDDNNYSITNTNGKLTVNRITSINEDENEIFSVYPNPINDKLIIKFKDSSIKGNIKIYSAKGELIYSKEKIATENIIDFNAQSAGLYILKVTTSNAVIVNRLVKR